MLFSLSSKLKTINQFKIIYYSIAKLRICTVYPSQSGSKTYKKALNALLKLTSTQDLHKKWIEKRKQENTNQRILVLKRNNNFSMNNATSYCLFPLNAFTIGSFRIIFFLIFIFIVNKHKTVLCRFVVYSLSCPHAKLSIIFFIYVHIVTIWS